MSRRQNAMRPHTSFLRSATRRARPLLVAAGFTLVAALAACSNDVEQDPSSSSPGNPGGAGPGPTGPGASGPGASGPGASGPASAGPGGDGPGPFFDCNDGRGTNPDGLACATEGETCFWGWECVSADLVCENGVWNMENYDEGVPDCPAEPVSGATCDDFCGLPSCSYTVETSCGPETVEAQCGPIGWSLPIACATDCTSLVDAGSCGADPACVWIGGCDATSQRCVRNVDCSFGDHPCPAGQVCTDMGINPCDPTALECDQCGALVSLCLPE